MRLVRLLAATGVALAAGAASAGPLVITPTTVTIAPERHSATVIVENASDETVDLQFRAYDWHQADGRDELTPSDGLVVSPPIVTVAPHAKQLFRVLRTDRAPPGGAERSWRLRLNQLPRAGQPAVAVYLEFSLPVFQPTPGAAAQLTWRDEVGQVTVTNTGSRHARVTTLALAHPERGASPIPGAASAYLLAGTSRTFAVPGRSLAAAGAHLVGTTDMGAVDVPPPALAAR